MKESLARVIFGSWYGLIKPISSSEYFKNLIDTLNRDFKTKKIWPEKSKVFRAFQITPYKNLKVVIIGMDPYPNLRANGLN